MTVCCSFWATLKHYLEFKCGLTPEIFSFPSSRPNIPTQEHLFTFEWETACVWGEKNITNKLHANWKYFHHEYLNTFKSIWNADTFKRLADPMYPLKFLLKYLINKFNQFPSGIIVKKKINSATKNSRILNGNRMCMFNKFGNFLTSFSIPSI